MEKNDCEIRTPRKDILLFTVEEDENGNLYYIARKGKTVERLTFEDIAGLMFKLLRTVPQKR